MPSINMIAARRADKRRQEKNIRNLAYAIAGEIGATLVVISVMALHWTGVNSHIGSLQQQIHKLQPTVAEIQQMQKDTADMQPKVTTLAGARADTLFWYNGFYAVTSALPAQAWLTSLATAGGSDGAPPGTVAAADPQLSLNGIALSEAQVGAVMLRMNQLSALDHVDLSSVNQQQQNGVATVTFQMTVHLKPEAAPPGTATKGGTSNA